MLCASGSLLRSLIRACSGRGYAASLCSRLTALRRRKPHSRSENRNSKILSRELRRHSLDRVQHEPHSSATLYTIAVRIELDKLIVTEVCREIAILISRNRREITRTAKLGRREGPLIELKRDRSQVGPN